MPGRGGGVRNTPVAVYCRLSKDDGISTSLDRQDSDCRGLALREGLDVIQTYTDNDTSGFLDVARPAYQRMLCALETGDIQGVIVWKLDRLTRKPREFEAFLDILNRTGARLWSVNESADITSPSGLMLLRIGMTFANYEAENISLRTRRAKLEAALEGKNLGGGPRLYGYNEDRTAIYPEEQALVLEAANRVVDGESVISIIKDWTARGLKTSLGNDWRATNLSILLRRPSIAGLKEHRGEVIAKAVWQPLIPEELWQQVRAALAARPGRRRKGIPKKHLLSGLVFCGKCGRPLYIHKREAEGVARYRCQSVEGGCGGLSILAAQLEEVVLSQVNPSDLISHMQKAPRLSQGLEELREAQRASEGLQKAFYVDGLMTPEAYEATARALMEKIRGLEAELAKAPEWLTPKDVEGFSDLPMLKKRVLLEALIKRIVIAPVGYGRRKPGAINPKRVVIEWIV